LKHIFLVHSEIVKRLVTTFINNSRIENIDVVLAYRRQSDEVPGFNSIKIDIFSLPGFALPSELNLFFRKLEIRRSLIVQLDAVIARLAGGVPFAFYTPNPWDEVSQIIISNKLCQRFFILEEGQFSYRPFGDRLDIAVWWKENVRSFLNAVTTNGRLKIIPHFRYLNRINYQGTIATSKLCFPKYPGKKIIVKINWGNYLVNSFYVRHLIILEALSRFVDDKYYFNVICDLIYNIVHWERPFIKFKFHPEHSSAFRGSFKEVVFNRFGFDTKKFLDDSIFVEGVGLGFGTTTYCSVSSAGYYIKINGGRVVSLHGRLCLVSYNFSSVFPNDIISN
jgi:hypothetical protein